MRRSLRALVPALVLLAAAPAAAPAAKKQVKPSLKVTAISPNRWPVAPGGKVRLNDGTNGCYVIGGPSGAPPSLTVYAFVRAVKVPANAPATLAFSTPWDRIVPTERLSGKLSDFLYRSKGRPQAALWGGAQGPYDRYRYRMLPAGTPASFYLSGDYSIEVTATVKGKKLRARGKITVAC